MNFAFFKLTSAEIERVLEWFNSHEHCSSERDHESEDLELVKQLRAFIGQDEESEG